MKKSFLLPSILLPAVLLSALGLRPASAVAPEASATATAAATEWTVDPGHSSVIFRTKHLGVSYFYGRFNEMEGVVHFDDDAPEECSIEVTIQAESIDTNSADRDRHLKSPDFFSAKEFPTITFKSSEVERTGEGRYAVTGDLTMRGKTKTITVSVEHTGSGESARMGRRVGFETTFEVDPRDYGFTFMIQQEGALGPLVRLTVSLECMKKS